MAATVQEASPVCVTLVASRQGRKHLMLALVWSNASSPMAATEVGMTTEVSLMQPWKVRAPTEYPRDRHRGSFRVSAEMDTVSKAKIA